jgi:hypothetical protein
MRLADFCNLHFKDEHPSRAWFPAFAEQPGESTLPDSLRPSQPPKPRWLFTISGPEGPKLRRPRHPAKLDEKSRVAEPKTDSTNNP